jgi:hypothetical protein
VSLSKQKITSLLVLLIVAGIGTYALVSSHASTPYASNEAESGTLSGVATEESDVNASGGKYVQFGGASSTGYTGSCTKYISPSTTSGAIASAEDSMSAGQTLCLYGGTYGDLTSDNNIYYASGTSSAPITITSAPGQTATIDGGEQIYGNYVTMEYLNMDLTNILSNVTGGANPDPPCSEPKANALQIEYGDGYTPTGDIIQYNNMYESNSTYRLILIFIDSGDDIKIRYNKLSDAGSCGQTQHIIYDDQGSGTEIYDNWMWGDPYGYAVQLYPNPGDTKVYSNVFDGMLDGVVDATAVGGDQTYDNVGINMVSSNSSGFSGGAFLDCYMGSTGTPDTITNNAIWNDPAGFGCSGGEPGVTISGSLTLDANPFVNSAIHNYNLSTNSAAAQLSGYGLWNGVGPPIPDPAP